MELKDFLDFLEEQAPPDCENWLESDWEKELDKRFPDWREIVKGPKNWKKIEKTWKVKKHRYLCKMMVKVAGVELASRWFDSEYEGQRIGSRYYIEELALSDCLTSNIWVRCGERVKRHIIYTIFDRYPGEPFERIERLERTIHEVLDHLVSHRDNINFPFGFPIIYWPQIEYIVPFKIRELRDIVEIAGDKKYLKFIDELIKERKKAASLRTR